MVPRVAELIGQSQLGMAACPSSVPMPLEAVLWYLRHAGGVEGPLPFPDGLSVFRGFEMGLCRFPKAPFHCRPLGLSTGSDGGCVLLMLRYPGKPDA